MINRLPMAFCADAVGMLGVALGTRSIKDPVVTGTVVGWATKFLRSSYERGGADDWQRCLFAVADRQLGGTLGLPIPNAVTTADVRTALVAKGLIDAGDGIQAQEDAVRTLELAVQEPPKDFSCEHAALRLAALEWVTHSPIMAEDEADSFINRSQIQALRIGPDVQVAWGPFYTGGILSFRNEGTEAAKNVRLQCSSENGWRPVLRPEVVASILPGGRVSVVDETGSTPGRGQSIAEFIHSLPSKRHRMTVRFEDRIGEERARDFRVVATGRHAMTESLAVTFYAEALRVVTPPVATRHEDGLGIGITNRPPISVSDQLRGFHDVASVSEVAASPSVGADKSQATDSAEMLRAQEARGPKQGRNAKMSVRRNEKYEGIDKALREFAAARPKSHEEVIRLLDDRKVAIPNRQPFKSAGGWLKGFQRNRHLASVWLSQAWGRLGLPSFPRGPKK